MDLMRMSDASRGMLLDGRNDFDRRKLENAETDLAASFDKFQSSTFTNRTELLDSMKQLQNFVVRSNNPFLGRVIEMAETNLTGATAYYLKNYPEIRETRDKRFFAALTDQIEKLKHDEAIRAQRMALWGLWGIPAVLLASIGVGLAQSSSVTKPLNRLVETLERIRHGDFTERPSLHRHDAFR